MGGTLCYVGLLAVSNAASTPDGTSGYESTSSTWSAGPPLPSNESKHALHGDPLFYWESTMNGATGQKREAGLKRLMLYATAIGEAEYTPENIRVKLKSDPEYVPCFEHPSFHDLEEA